MTTMTLDQQYGPLPKDSHALTRRCRLLQSWYRVEVLKQSDCGPWRRGGRKVGSTLVGGEASGANFLSHNAFEYAKAKVEEKQTNPELTIDAYRLFNNMLSSMPMCFNLFSDLRTGVESSNRNATSVLSAMFAESRIESISDLEIELIPRPIENYIDDLSAFDAAILFRDLDGCEGIVAIETKYTDRLGGNRASREDRKHSLADQLGLFTPEGTDWYRTNGFDQVARNLLLTLAYAQRHDCANAINYVLGLEQDAEGRNAVDSIQSRLNPEYRDRIRWLPLQEVVERGLSVATDPFDRILQQFHLRYLDLTIPERLLNGEMVPPP